MVQTTLYDLPSKAPAKTWSLNPGKARVALNYKGIDYKTQWVEYPDLEQTLKSFGIPPNDRNEPGFFTYYTSPAIQFEDGTYMMDSWKIAHELEKRYPTPSLHLDEPVVVQVKDLVPALSKALSANYHPKVPAILPERSAEYFERTRKVRFGMSLAEYGKTKGGEKPWEDVQEPAKQIANLLNKTDGPFFLGQTFSYADIIFVTFLRFMQIVDQDLFQRFVSIDPSFTKVFEASKEWLKKDD